MGIDLNFLNLDLSALNPIKWFEDLKKIKIPGLAKAKEFFLNIRTPGYLKNQIKTWVTNTWNRIWSATKRIAKAAATRTKNFVVPKIKGNWQWLSASAAVFTLPMVIASGSSPFIPLLAAGLPALLAMYL
jgi:hypothetical protein